MKNWLEEGFRVGLCPLSERSPAHRGTSWRARQRPVPHYSLENGRIWIWVHRLFTNCCGYWQWPMAIIKENSFNKINQIINLQTVPLRSQNEEGRSKTRTRLNSEHIIVIISLLPWQQGNWPVGCSPLFQGGYSLWSSCCFFRTTYSCAYPLSEI